MAHLTNEQRYTISRMLESGYSQSERAKTLDKDKSVVSRELKRNSDTRSSTYRSDLAQRKANNRHKAKPKRIRFTDEVKADVEALLKEIKAQVKLQEL